MADAKDLKNKELKNFEEYLKSSLRSEANSLDFEKIVSDSQENVLKRFADNGTNARGFFENVRASLYVWFSKPVFAILTIFVCIIFASVSVTGFVLYQRNSPERHINQTLDSIDESLLELQLDENDLQQSDQYLGELDQSI